MISPGAGAAFLLMTGWLTFLPAPSFAAQTKPGLFILAMDGLDWRLTDKAFKKGLMPNFKRAIQRARRSSTLGTSGEPIRSPVIWTTIATGKLSSKHGVEGFTSRRTDRQVKAIWNIFSEAGRRVGVVGYLVTSPAEPVNGVIVSDLMDTYPPKILEDTGFKHPFPPDQASADKILSRLTGSRRNPGGMPGRLAERAQHLVENIYAKDERNVRIARHLLDRLPFDLFIVYLQGLDLTAHEFFDAMEPNWEEVPEDVVRTFGSTLLKYYSQTDEWIGELLQYTGPDSTLCILSDHGSKRKPVLDYGPPAGTHSPEGVFVLKGPRVHPGTTARMRHQDVLPTLLYLSGLPVAQDMDGLIYQDMVAADYLERTPARFIRSYETSGIQRDQSDAIRLLRRAGYID